MSVGFSPGRLQVRPCAARWPQSAAGPPGMLGPGKSCGIPGNRSTTQRTTFAVLWNLQMVTQQLLAVNRPVEILKHVVKDTLNLQESTRWSGIPRTVQSLQVLINPGNDFWRPTIFRHFRGGTLSIIGEITTTTWESLDLSNKKSWN